MCKKIIIATLVLINLSFTVNAQKKPAKEQVKITGRIFGVAKPYKNKIALRWNVDNYQLFQSLVLGGVVIDRVVLNKENKVEGEWQRITPDTIKALPLAAFAAYKNDTGKMIIAQSIYGRPSSGKGGSLIESIKLQDQEWQNKHFFATLYSAFSYSNAQVLGVGFEDKIEVDTAKKYVYRITPLSHNKIEIIDTGFVFAVGSDLLVEEKVLMPYAEGLDKKIMLTWPAAINKFTAYYIERSEDKGDKKRFTRLNSLPYVAKADTLNGKYVYIYYDSVNNYQRYYYRIKAINAFGEEFISEYDVFATAVDYTPPTPLSLTFTQKDSLVTFNWNKSNDGDLKRIYLVEGKTLKTIDSVFNKEPLQPSTLTYNIVMDEMKLSAGYFRLLLIDSNNNYSYSNSVYAFIPDKTPPNAPYGLTGNIDSTGLVTINWMPDSTEALRGYKILMSNDSINYVNLTDMIQDTAYSYQTTMETLSKDIYFIIVSIDGSYNHSDPSEVLHLKRPLKLKPLPPVFLDIEVSVKKVTLQWSESHSEDFDHFIVYRKISDTLITLWDSIAQTTEPSFADSLIKANHTYEYTVAAISKENIASDFAFPVRAIVGRLATDDDITFSVSKNQTEKKYELSWSKPKKEVSFYILYKDTGQGLAMYKSIPATQLSFSDAMDSDVNAAYGMVVRYVDNSSSEIIKAEVK